MGSKMTTYQAGDSQGSEEAMMATKNGNDVRHRRVNSKEVATVDDVLVDDNSHQPPFDSTSQPCRSKGRLKTFSELPTWMRDNEYLLSSHRPQTNSFIECFKSLFYLHSETGNIWTHLIGFLLFVVLFVCLYSFHGMIYVDQLMFLIFFLGCLTCLAFSTIFHTCHCHSPTVAKVCRRMDYCGISALITGSMIPIFFYGFESRSLMWIYLGGLTVLCSISVIVSLMEKFGTPKFRPLRAGVFLTFGLSALIPGIHWFVIMHPRFLFCFVCVCVQGGLYVLGATIYALRIPERFMPGKFDIWFQSHQIFHVLVVAAAIVHLRGLFEIQQLHRSPLDAPADF